MGQVVNAWGNVTRLLLKSLFEGEDDFVTLLTSLVAGGRMIDGVVDGLGEAPEIDMSADGPTLSDLQASIQRHFRIWNPPSCGPWPVPEPSSSTRDTIAMLRTPPATISALTAW